MDNNYNTGANYNNNNNNMDNGSGNGFISKFRSRWSYNEINKFANFPIIAYFIKFLVDLVMYIFSVYEQNDIYYDLWYLFIPQVVTSAFMVVYHILYFKHIFLGMMFKISAAVVIVLNIAFIVILSYDMTIGYIFYFALVGMINFVNGLFLKCNIIPARKVGSAEVAPLIFEITSFVTMVFGALAMIFAFPYLQVIKELGIQYWDFLNLYLGIKLNIVTDFVLFVCYLWSRYNNSEFIRDNMFDESELYDE
ncbi:MAG: hypothetical protein II998_06260 [Clostridia bacterium]|nr:hypothetical protein [Clostridia bacterium]